MVIAGVFGGPIRVGVPPTFPLLTAGAGSSLLAAFLEVDGRNLLQCRLRFIEVDGSDGGGSA